MAPRLDELLKAAGEPTRLRILNLLREGSICVCEIQAFLQLPQPTVSRHLAALRHAGLVSHRRDGTRIMYALTVPTTISQKAFWRFLSTACDEEEMLRRDLQDMLRHRSALQETSPHHDGNSPDAS